jgi:aconitase A
MKSQKSDSLTAIDRPAGLHLYAPGNITAMGAETGAAASVYCSDKTVNSYARKQRH